jgi:hypothetical protein
MSVPAAQFGPGILIATRTDLTPATPINIGYAQEFSIEFAGTNKALYGQKQLPLVQARGTIKPTGKFKSAVLSGTALNALFWGTTFTTGGIAWNIDSTFSVSTLSTSVTVGSSSSFDANLGVKYAATGLPLMRVSTGAEVVGSYSQSGNVLAFATADNGAALKITYTNTTAVGQSLLATNSLIGTTPTFQLDYYTNLNQPTAKPFVIRLYQAIMSKYTMDYKLEDYMMPAFEFDLMANASDQIFTKYFPEVS